LDAFCSQNTHSDGKTKCILYTLIDRNFLLNYGFFIVKSEILEKNRYVRIH